MIFIKKNVDIIIVGSQSRTVPIDNGNLSNYTFPQIEYLFATQPDAFVICVNPWDDLTYIERTIKFLESSVNGKVILIVVCPYDICVSEDGLSYSTIPLSLEQYYIVANRIESYLGLPVFSLNDCEHNINFIKIILSFFSEDT